MDQLLAMIISQQDRQEDICTLGGLYMGLIAVIIVWSIIEATCAKNATPLLILLGIYAVISIIAEFAY